MASYTFLPFLRRGIASQATANVENGRLNVPIKLQVIGEGETLPPPIEQTLQLFGPGDVTGFNYPAIIRTVPRAGVNDFESNFLAAIEFYDEDFVWRYSPSIPENGRLKPWIWLIVLTENEFLRIRSNKNRLSVIEIKSEALQSAFPLPETIDSWAHVHLNFTPMGTTAKDIGVSIQQNLDQNPNLGCSRLVCPRRLRPDTRYTAFVIPAFEKGRLAGLGRTEEEIAAIPNSQVSWSGSSEIPGFNQFPVYYEWAFCTSSEGDFEDLARRLSPISIAELNELIASTKHLDVRDPGWGITGAEGAIRLESALKLPELPPDTPDELSDKKVLSKKIAPLLNLGIEALGSANANNIPHPYFNSENDLSKKSNLEDDPIITPPIYGSFYRPAEKLDSDNSQSWFGELNLNPVYRVAAAAGAVIVQNDQEELMDMAWEQLGTYADKMKIENRWVISGQLSQKLGLKRIKPLAESTDPFIQYRATSFFSPLLPTIKTDGTAGLQLFNLSNLNVDKPSTLSPSFLKVTRKGGPFMRRFSDKPKGIFFVNKQMVALSQIPTTPLQRTANVILSWLNSNTESSEHLIKTGLGGLESLKKATGLLLPYVSKQSPRVTPKNALHNSTTGEIWTQIAPEKTIMARFTSLIGNKSESESNGNKPPAPVFKTATYAKLAERNTDFILPGLEKIPQNRVTILFANNKFIESYLVGLNHEMAREFFWREFPAPLNATYFSQFWDVRNSTNPKLDIKPILNWESNSKIGSNRGSSGAEPIVVAIRGDLLRKYPNTEIFMVKAAWENKNIGSHKLVPDETMQVLDSPNLCRPLFSARIEPDFTFLGFSLTKEDVRGNAEAPGWFFVMKERAGDTHFGMDLFATQDSNDPSWDKLTDTPLNQCININSSQFSELPRAGKRADQVASMLYQRPFMLFVHASRLLPDF